MPVSRRALLAALAAARPALAAPPALRVAARRARLELGAASEADLSTEPDYAALFTSNCDLLAPNLNWQRLSPRAGGPLIDIDGSVPVVRAAGLRLTGYHLLWHQRLPQWFAPLARADAERAIVEHIRTMATAFARDSFSWNVVNEAILPAHGRPDGLRPSPLADKFGPALFDIAFHAALERAPDVLRVYNDYDLELATQEHERRRAALLHLLDTLQARAVPVQAIGLQCHLRADTFDQFDPATFRRFLAELTRRGLGILITELDVLDPPTGDSPTRDRRIAEVYRRFLDVALAEPQVRALMFWGLTDRHTWLNDPGRRSFRRADGGSNRPLLFDRELQPKPAFAAVLAALDAAPVRLTLSARP